MAFIQQVEPLVTAREAEAARDYIMSGGWLTEFRQTAMFEDEIAAFLDVPHCVVVPSGTVALYLALRACGIGPGDRVIVPDYTMIATPNAVRWVGAEVVLAEIDPETMCLNLEDVRPDASIRALVYVSINGRAGDMSEVRRFCRCHGLFLIEDACQAMGSRASDLRHLGCSGDVGCFSFSPHKIITTGQGGALVMHDADLCERVRKLKDFHRVAPATDRHDDLGFNFKFTDLQAVIGREQIKDITRRVDRKKWIYESYFERLKDIPEIDWLPVNQDHVVPWFVDILLPSESVRDTLLTSLRESDIGSRPFYPPVHTQPMYAGQGPFPVTESLASRGLWLPSSLGIAEHEIDRVCSAIAGFFGRAG